MSEGQVIELRNGWLVVATNIKIEEIRGQLFAQFRGWFQDNHPWKGTHVDGRMYSMILN